MADESTPDQDGTRRYVRREKKLQAERERQTKHGRSLLELDRFTARRAQEAEKKKAARQKPASKKRRAR